MVDDQIIATLLYGSQTVFETSQPVKRLEGLAHKKNAQLLKS
jgi:hypothetical protein